MRVGPASAALKGSLSNQSSRKSASAMGSARRSPLIRFAPSPRAAKAAGMASGRSESSWSGGCFSSFRRKPANAPTSATNSGKRAASLAESPATASRARSGSRGSANQSPSRPQAVSTRSGAISSRPWRPRSRSRATAGSSEGRVSGNTGNWNPGAISTFAATPPGWPCSPIASTECPAPARYAAATRASGPPPIAQMS